tara:strand:+ start:8569 stop:9180 length:612 start_codon:yes stop_codon:yes gene_type:complete
MGKKCVPGLICIENMTFFLLILVILLFIYIWYNQYRIHQKTSNNTGEKVVFVNTSSNIPQMVPIASRQDIFNDPYSPPGKNPVVYPRNSGDVRGIPVNVQTRGVDNDYQQMGILTRSNYSGDEMILPLMGRKHMSGRDKWQYYTISGTGNLNTKLPISVNGRSCTSEYGCDDIYNGDTVYVEGYKDTFNATIYENNQFHYIPA